MPRRSGYRKPSSSPLCNNKSALGVAPFSLWNLLGKPSISVRYPYAVERIFCLKGLENIVQSGTFVYLLDGLEGKEWCCF